MAEHVEREKLLTDICDDMCGLKYTGVCENCRVVALIADAPAADVAPVVHARWIYDKKAQRPYCSVCKGYFYGATNSPMSYCPKCGAMMDGEP